MIDAPRQQAALQPPNRRSQTPSRLIPRWNHEPGSRLIPRWTRLALADLIGLDTLLVIMEVLQADFGDSKYRPAWTLRELVAADDWDAR